MILINGATYKQPQPSQNYILDIEDRNGISNQEIATKLHDIEDRNGISNPEIATKLFLRSY